METLEATVSVPDPAIQKWLAVAMPLGIKLLQIVGTLVLCWILIRVSSRVVKGFLQRQAKKQYMPITERKANTLSSVTSSIL